jgi:hypothetical protein
VMDHLNSGYLQLGLFALASAGLQVWWISSVFKRRDLARPMSEGEFSRSLERIWKKNSRIRNQVTLSAKSKIVCDYLRCQGVRPQGFR